MRLRQCLCFPFGILGQEAGTPIGGAEMVLVEWQCPKTDHSPMMAYGIPGSGETTTETSSVVLVDPPPDGKVWQCWKCGTALERGREVPHNHPYAGVEPKPSKVEIIPVAGPENAKEVPWF